MYETELLQDIKALAGFPLFGLLILITFIIGETSLSAQLFVGLILAFALTATIRAFCFKQRPIKQKFSVWWQKIDAASFPSLHAMRAAVLAVLLAVYFNNLLLTILFTICAIAVAVSRVQLKRHFPRDVVAGLILGVIVAFVSIWLARFIS